MPTATEIFELLETRDNRLIERYELHSNQFNILRRALKSLVFDLQEGGDLDGTQLSNQFRSLLSRWLTVPVEYDGSFFGELKEICDPKIFSDRWGSNLGGLFNGACKAAEALANTENPMRSEMERVLRQLRAEGLSFKIYCHRTARESFKTLSLLEDEEPLNTNDFLHSPSEYRASEPFSFLIKCGPFRSRGWGSAPDAVFTAPRFDNIAQFVWIGCADEEGFGYDPAVATSVSGGSNYHRNKESKIRWKNVTTRSDSSEGAGIDFSSDEDEFLAFAELAKTQDSAKCVLVQFDEGHGMLHPPTSRILSFDPSSSKESSISQRLIYDGLSEGMFVIVCRYEDIDCGALRIEEGIFSTHWKKRLDEEYSREPDALKERLQKEGVHLRCMDLCIRNWIKPASSVIHAPQSKEHFDNLMKVLGLEDYKPENENKSSLSWVQRAWNEIRRARGEAIQDGRLEHNLIEEGALNLLNNHLPIISENCLAQNSFMLQLDQESGVAGSFTFHKVLAIEHGFRAPLATFRTMLDTNEIEQWRD